jgi:hypothetical protein
MIGMKTLVVSKQWYDWFNQSRIELVTTIDNRELFITTIKGEIPGNQLNYHTIFKLIEAYKDAFSFLAIDKIRLEWSEDLSKQDFQFNNQGEEYYSWKDSILKKNFEIENSYFSDYGDCTEVFYNYYIDQEEESSTLYHCNHFDRTALFLWFVPQTNLTFFKFEIELRKSLFKLDENFEINLPKNFLKQNLALLKNSEKILLSKLNEL